MPKRKRDDGDLQEVESHRGAKQQRVQHKLKVGVTKLGHAFKVAKGFERQKLGRRRKTAVAEKNDNDISRIDTEIDALKTLDTSKSAEQYLCKTLLKDKRIAEHTDLPPDARGTIKGSTDKATLNVLARLYKSNQAKDAMNSIVVDIQKALGLKTDPLPSLKARTRPSKDSNDATSAAGNKFEHVQDLDRVIVRDPRPRGRSAEPSNESNDEVDQDKDEFDAYQDRIAPSPDQSDEEFSDIEQLEQRLLDENGINRGPPSTLVGYNVEADLSISHSEPGSVSASPEPQKSTMGKKTAFLPSLTMGGYISGSDSDIEDVDVAPKKNRRGQRARQQIWEQKFGTNAKHLHKQTHASQWDPKRGAVDRSERRGGRSGGSRTGRPKYQNVVSDSAVSSYGKTPATKQRDDGGALHPSWEAAKKAKEKKEAPIAFQGKKITFD